MSYFGPGLWHLSAALAFAGALGLLERGEAMARVRDPLFVAALLVSSCALFFVPQSWARRGVWKFLRFPLPDWDMLLLGSVSHRHFLSHSAWLPLALVALKYLQPAFWARWPHASAFALGLCVGIASHLAWDLAGSRACSIVVVPRWWTLRTKASRLWLAGNVALSLVGAGFFADLSRAINWATRWLQGGWV